MHFETIKYDDLSEIRKLQPDGWSDIVSEFKFYIDSSYCFPLKVSFKDKIIGIGASIVYDNTSWLAHIIVDKNFRNQGVGYEIVERLLEELKNNSIDSCLLISTASGLSVYKKAGFRIVSEYIFLKEKNLGLIYQFLKM